MEAQRSPATEPSGGRRPLIALALAVTAVYLRVVSFQFLIYDDDRYVTGNPVVSPGLSLEGLRWAFTHFHEGTYQPLTWISHMLDANVWGTWAGGHHLTNLLLHGASTLVLYLVLRRATGRPGPSLLVASLWALHPLQVQSVAWVAERKGLLATLFGLLALARYQAWVWHARRRDGILTHVLFAASLLSKPTWVVLPALLLLWDRWPLAREASWRARLREKSGLLAMAAVGAVVASRAQVGALSTLEMVGFGTRLANAAVAFERTLRRMIAPVDLVAFQPLRADLPPVEILAGVLLLALGSVVAWRWRRTRPMVRTGWLWALVTFLPTAGLIQFGAQSTADRFAVLPLLGVLIASVYALAPVEWPATRFYKSLSGLLVVAAAVGTFTLLPTWHDTIRLFERNLRVTGGSSLVHFNLGLAYEQRGDAPAAIEQYTRALEYAPASAEILLHLSDALWSVGNHDASEQRVREALEVSPMQAAAQARLGQILLERDDFAEAGRSFFKATKIEPDEPRWLILLAQAMAGLQRPADQIGLYQRALALKPDLPQVRGEMAWVMATTADSTLRDPEQALLLAQAEVQLSGGTSPRALEVLAAALAVSGRPDEARQAVDEAVRLAQSMGLTSMVDEIMTRRALYLPVGG